MNIDGDTLKIKYQSSEENIRLIGIDTPESKINKKAEKDSKRRYRFEKFDPSFTYDAQPFVKGWVCLVIDNLYFRGTIPEEKKGGDINAKIVFDAIWYCCFIRHGLFSTV